MRNDVIILAAGNYWDSVSRYMNRASSSRENWLFVLFALAIAGIWMALFFWERFRSTRQEQHAASRSLFEELCQAHGINPQDISLLLAAAQHCQLPSPAYIFTQPEWLDQLSAEGQPQAAAYHTLRDRLFGAL